ncbi:ROK family protein [Phytoactinopolyspora endophytica]|uniref:ROK family protein n=1 Tax=Phytoactinopolyspora endophytica TaxID=1642495 RepID=UPI00197CAEC6|nr:ROK family protein [Phytoactinopolyspora endophytica]
MGGARRRPVVAGIDIGGTTTSAVLMDGEGAVVGHASAPTPARTGGAAMLDTAVDVVTRTLDASAYRLTAVGVGAAGVVDRRSGIIVAASDSFRDWAGFPLAEELRLALGVPAVVENDVNAFVEGERRFGAVRGFDDVLAVTLGTGVGGALVLGGELYTGPNGAAGEIGHVAGFGDRPCSCGRTGHLETLASGRSIARRYLELSAGRAHTNDGRSRGRTPGTVSLTAAEVASLARSGDPDAVAVFDEAGRAVGRAAVMVATLIDVVHVVIGGGVACAWDLLELALKAEISSEPPVSDQPVVVTPSALGPRAVAVGAAAMAGG